MGWWVDQEDGKELIVGDAPYDILADALQQVVEEYQEEWERKPTLTELIHALKVVLGAHLERYTADGETLELEALKVKTKKRRKSQAYQVGDFFAIPLSDGRYAFGRILSDLLHGRMGMLVGIYNIVNARILTPQELRGLPFMFTPFHSSDEGWTTWRWRILGRLPLSEHEFIYPQFKQGDEHRGWKLVDRHQTRSATQEEVEGLEYCSLWTLQGIEGRIEKHLSKLNQNL